MLMQLALNGFSISQIAIMLIVCAGVIAVVVVVLRQLNVQIPAFVITIAWICFAVIIGVMAIKLLLSIW